MNQQRITELKEIYRKALLDDVVPFWLKHTLDHENGGYFNNVGPDGEIYDTDKSMWLQGRAVWMLSKLYNTVEKRQEWLDAATLIYDFMVQHGFDTDGRMFFATTADGKPLRKRRYIATETFGTIACSEYAIATGDKDALKRAKDTYRLILDLINTPGRLEPKTFPQTRQTKAHGLQMVLLSTTQQIRLADDDPLHKEVVDNALDQILNQFMRPEIPALLENLDADGNRMDSVDGRIVNPGHAIESAWFIMEEARHRNDDTLIKRALEIIEWSLEIGWDKEYGGLLYFVDVEGKPPTQLEWDMKLWWPHTESIYALLLAYHLTGDKKWANWYEKMHEWTFAHFPDPKNGEWYGYLHRDGSVSTPLKGGMWKGMFHVPRGLWCCMMLLDEMKGK
jgi:N-acylglucosamine 2-epimerase